MSPVMDRTERCANHVRLIAESLSLVQEPQLARAPGGCLWRSCLRRNRLLSARAEDHRHLVNAPARGDGQLVVPSLEDS
jgi:hypothetical protein